MKFKVGDKVIVKYFRQFKESTPINYPKDSHSEQFYGKVVTIKENTNKAWYMEVTNGKENLSVMEDQIFPAYFVETELFKALNGEIE